MPNYYPAFLDIQGKPVVVVGGGAIAEGKARHLLECGARVSLVAPQVTQQLETWAADGTITWLPREYREGDLAGAALAIVSTNQAAVNQQATDEAHLLGVLVNTVDDPGRCDFIVPAVLRRGELTVAVSTGGGSPALARHVRQELERVFPPEYAELLQVVAEVRVELRRRGIRVAPKRWQEALDDELKALVRGGSGADAKARLIRLLEEDSGSPDRGHSG